MLDKGYGFEDAKSAARVIKVVGGHIEIPEPLADRPALIERRDGKVRVAIRRVDTDGDLMPTDKSGKWFVRYVNIKHDESYFPEFDHELRAVTLDVNHAGWMAWDSARNEWDHQPGSNIKLLLKGSGVRNPEPEMGRMLNKRRRLVQRAFQPEYPSDNEWNFDAPQYRFEPADVKVPHHLSWDLILDHVGNELNEVLKRHPWAKQHGIKTGRHYLQLWVASMLREPYEPLPYLFLYGPENSGKSILHEAIEKLITRGACRADKALTTTSDFNGELHNSVLAVVEETNVAKAGECARSRMKDWVTGEFLNTRKMGRDSFLSEKQPPLYPMQQ